MHPRLKTQVSAPQLEVLEPRPKKPRSYRWWFLALVVVLVIAGALYRQRQEAARQRQAKLAAGTIRTVAVRRAPLEQTLRLTGTTAAEKYANLITPTLRGRRRGSGEYALILQRLIKPGSRVKKGDVLAEFDRQWMLNRLDDQIATVKQHELYLKTLQVQLGVRRKGSEQRIRAAKATVDKAGLDLKTIPVRSAIKAELLRQAYGDSQAVLKQMMNEPKYLDISEVAAMRRSELDLQVEKLDLKRAQNNVERMVARAPMDGLAVLQRIYRGSELYEIQAGDQLGSGQPFMQVVDLRSMIVNASANQVDSELLRVGAAARVRFDAYPGLELPARVASVGAIAVSGGYRQSWIKNIPVRLKIEKADPRAIPNFSVSADVILKAEPDRLVVPLECVFYDGRTPIAFVQGPSGWEKRQLKLGLANNVATAVDSGLREGETVATRRPGESVTASVQ